MNYTNLIMISTYKTILTEKKQLTTDVFIYKFKLADPAAISFIPGQYLILFVPQEGKEPVRRLYSIASANTVTNEFELLIKLVPNGLASMYLEKLPIESEVLFQGPAGMFTLRESSREKIALVTGTGYAPIRSVLLSQALSTNYTLFLGTPYYKEVFLLEELKELAEKNPNFKFFICLSREQNLDIVPQNDRNYFFLGRVTNGFEELIKNLKLEISNLDYYLCSGREVVESLKTYLYEKGVPKEQVYFEKF